MSNKASRLLHLSANVGNVSILLSPLANIYLFYYYSPSLQADASNEKASAADQTATSEEGTESPVAGWRNGLFLSAHRLDLRSSRHTDPESSPNVEELRGVAYFTTAAHHAGRPTESADGDDVAQPADGAPAVLPDEAALTSTAVHPATEHVRDVLDTTAALASGAARQDHESFDSDRAGAHY